LYHYLDIRGIGGFKHGNGGKMKKRGKTNRLKAALKRKDVRRCLRKSKGERKYPT